MRLTSFAFKDGGVMSAKYTCDGDNVSPPLIISDVPSDAVSLALIVDDPDAPGEVWVHWTLWGISPETDEIEEDTVPQGTTEGLTSFGCTGYGGPCPPTGSHHYFFKLYALDIELELDSEADKKEIEDAMREHIVEEARLIGIYSREKKKQ